MFEHLHMIIRPNCCKLEACTGRAVRRPDQARGGLGPEIHIFQTSRAGYGPRCHRAGPGRAGAESVCPCRPVVVLTSSCGKKWNSDKFPGHNYRCVILQTTDWRSVSVVVSVSVLCDSIALRYRNSTVVSIVVHLVLLIAAQTLGTVLIMTFYAHRLFRLLKDGWVCKILLSFCMFYRP